MGESGRFQQFMKFLIVACFFTIIVGSVFIYELTLPNVEYNLSEPHLLPQVPPASELPGEEVEFEEFDNLSIKLELIVWTSENHKGDRDAGARLDVFIINNGNDAVSDLCFWRMTVYWIDGSANFTRGLKPQTNYSVEAKYFLSVAFTNLDIWTEIPASLYMSSSHAYGRVLVSYRGNRTTILTTSQVSISRITE